MATPLTAIVSEELPQVANFRRYVYSVPNLNANTVSEVYSLNVGEAAGRIDYVRLSFKGTGADLTFDFLVIDNASAIGTYQNILTIGPVAGPGLSRQYNLGIVYSNDEADPPTIPLGFSGTPELYLVVENTDALVAADDIVVEIGIK